MGIFDRLIYGSRGRLKEFEIKYYYANGNCYERVKDVEDVLRKEFGLYGRVVRDPQLDEVLKDYGVVHKPDFEVDMPQHCCYLYGFFRGKLEVYLRYPKGVGGGVLGVIGDILEECGFKEEILIKEKLMKEKGD